MKFNTHGPVFSTADKNNTLLPTRRPIGPHDACREWLFKVGGDKREKNKQIGYSMNDPLPSYRDDQQYG